MPGCPEIPMWFVWLAVMGAVFLASALLYGAARIIAHAYLATHRPVTHIAELDKRRRLFG